VREWAALTAAGPGGAVRRGLWLGSRPRSEVGPREGLERADFLLFFLFFLLLFSIFYFMIFSFEFKFKHKFVDYENTQPKQTNIQTKIDVPAG
jgi:hypothetical protein